MRGRNCPRFRKAAVPRKRVARQSARGKAVNKAPWSTHQWRRSCNNLARPEQAVDSEISASRTLCEHVRASACVPMPVCLFACACICACMHAWIRTRSCTCARAQARAWVPARMPACEPACLHAPLPTYLPTCMPVFMHARARVRELVCACMRAYMRVRACVRACFCALALVCLPMCLCLCDHVPQRRRADLKSSNCRQRCAACASSTTARKNPRKLSAPSNQAHTQGHTRKCTSSAHRSERRPQDEDRIKTWE